MITNRQRRRLNRFRRILRKKLLPMSTKIVDAKSKGQEPSPETVAAGRVIMKETMRRYDHLLNLNLN